MSTFLLALFFNSIWSISPVPNNQQLQHQIINYERQRLQETLQPIDDPIYIFLESDDDSEDNKNTTSPSPTPPPNPGPTPLYSDDDDIDDDESLEIIHPITDRNDDDDDYKYVNNDYVDENDDDDDDDMEIIDINAYEMHEPSDMDLKLLKNKNIHEFNDDDLSKMDADIDYALQDFDMIDDNNEKKQKNSLDITLKLSSEMQDIMITHIMNI